MKNKHEYKQCTNCILDTNDDPNMVFDKNGVCHYCHNYKRDEGLELKKGKEAEALLSSTIKKIKDYGKNEKLQFL